MNHNPFSLEVNQRSEGFVLHVGSLAAVLSTLHDRRHARGLRYRLVVVLIFIVLAKLCGEDHLRGIAQWIGLRKDALATALGLARPQAPHASTYGRVLAHAVCIEQFEQVVGQFLAEQQCGRGNTVVSLDGKTLRATIPAGQSHGLHLLAAYLPNEGLVLLQVEVGSHENEIPAAMRVVKCIDLRGKVVTGDAMLAQGELSAQIVEAGGEYLWKVKRNQTQLLQDIKDLFAPESCVPGFSPCHKDFRSVTTHDKGHGRIETRKLTASSMLKGFLDWPYAEQVFCLERRSVRVQDGKVTREITYGVTSLTAREADPARLLEITRGHWGIENGLHYRRDETLREDRCRLKGHGAQMMAAINNLVLGLLLPRGVRNVPDARRYYAANPQDAVALVMGCPV